VGVLLLSSDWYICTFLTEIPAERWFSKRAEEAKKQKLKQKWALEVKYS